MKLIEILSEDRLEGLKEKLSHLDRYEEHSPKFSPRGDGFILKFFLEKSITDNLFEEIKRIIQQEGFTILDSDREYDVEPGEKIHRPYILFK